MSNVSQQKYSKPTTSWWPSPGFVFALMCIVAGCVAFGLWMAIAAVIHR
jgi:hypothetical protein